MFYIKRCVSNGEVLSCLGIDWEAMMSSKGVEVVVTFTGKTIERILRDGGTSSWHLNRRHARLLPFAICTRNARSKSDEKPGPEAHRLAFLIGKIKDVVRSPDHDEGRFLILFSEYALVNVPDAWKGDRNPVKYSTLEEFGIDPSKLKWHPMPEPTAVPESVPPTPKTTQVGALSIPDAKRGLSLTFGVPQEAIEITIRG